MKPSTDRDGILSGFTLVELLIVIGIIAVLIAMLLPALNKAQFQSKVISCASNQRQIYMAMTMYANDNNGYMPGSNSAIGNAGAFYVQSAGTGSIGWYPWETNPANWEFINASILPPDVIPRTTKRFYGVGVLVGGRYLPPTQVVQCTDFVALNNDNYSYNDQWLLAGDYYQAQGNVQNMWSGGIYSANAGSYVLNSIPYYSPDAPAKGKLGGKGRPGGWSSFGGYTPLPNIDAVIMCFTSQAASSAGNGPAIAHNYQGVNCTFRDGHVDWLPLTSQDWAMINGLTPNSQITRPNSTEFDMGGHYTSSFWNWATAQEPNQ